MARGKIVYTPAPSRALSLDGSHHLSLASAVFNAGVEDFGHHALVYLEEPDADEAWICGKGADDLRNKCGWRFIFVRRYMAIGLYINDGQPEPNLFLSPENSVPAYGWHWLGFTLDRNGDPWFYIDGVPYEGYVGAGEYGAGDLGAGGSKDPADYPGSLDNDEPLIIGKYFTGLLDFIRFDYGRAVPAAWWAEEWDRIRYGYPRNMDWFTSDFAAAWDFDDELMDLVAGYLPTYEGGGAPAYASGWPYSEAPLEVVFEHNYRHDRIFGHLEQDDYARALDGTLQSYSPAVRKRRFTLPFNTVNHAQMTALLAACTSGEDIGLYLHADYPRTCRARIITPPDFAGLETKLPRWEGEAELESI